MTLEGAEIRGFPAERRCFGLKNGSKRAEIRWFCSPIG
jgi:hypothetical protein